MLSLVSCRVKQNEKNGSKLDVILQMQWVERCYTQQFNPDHQKSLGTKTVKPDNIPLPQYNTYYRIEEKALIVIIQHTPYIQLD